MVINVKINGILHEIDAITYFENIDIDKEPELNLDNVVHRGKIGESYVKDNYNVLIMQMFYLKKDICFLTDNAKLKFIEDKFAKLKPKNPNFDHVLVNQAFFQLDVYWCEFIDEYKKYLSKKIEAASYQPSDRINILAFFADNIEEQIHFKKKIYDFNSQLYLTRAEDKMTFLVTERQKIFEQIKNSSLFAWWPKTKEYFEIENAAWNINRRKHLESYASSHLHYIKNQYNKQYDIVIDKDYGLKFPIFEFKDPELIEYILNFNLLYHIDDFINEYKGKNQFDNKKKRLKLKPIPTCESYFFKLDFFEIFMNSLRKNILFDEKNVFKGKFNDVKDEIHTIIKVLIDKKYLTEDPKSNNFLFANTLGIISDKNDKTIRKTDWTPKKERYSYYSQIIPNLIK